MNSTHIIETMLIFLFSVAANAKDADTLRPATEAPPAEAASPFYHLTTLQFGATLLSSSQQSNTHETAMWLGTVNTKIGFELSPLHWYSSLYATYGQTHAAHLYPVKNQDDFILSVTPSLTIESSEDIRVFLDITAETQMREGMIDSQKTAFFDPAFVNNTIYFGKMTSEQNGSTSAYHLFYGIGYTFQSTITNHFILVGNRPHATSDSSPVSVIQSQVTFNSGVALIFDIDYQHEFAENVSYCLGFKNVVYGEEHFWRDLKQNRASSLLVASLKYRFFSLNYCAHLIYDASVSPMRQLDQTMVVGLDVTL